MTEDYEPSCPYFEDLGGETIPFVDEVPASDSRWTAFNPSIGFCPELGYAALVRSSNYNLDPVTSLPRVVIGDTVRNYLWFSELDDDLKPTNLRQIDFSYSNGPEIYKGIEDARLFSRDGEWYFLGVMLENHTPKTRLALYRLDQDKNRAYFIKRYESWDYTGMEKNWMPVSIDKNPNFDYIYSPTGYVKSGRFYLNPCYIPAIVNIRGGSCLWPLEDGSYLAVTHRPYYRPVIFYDPETKGMAQTHDRKYVHQFVRYNNYGSILEVSDEFTFEGRKIEFCAGLVEKDGKYILSYGKSDLTSGLAIIDKDKALASLRSVVDDEFD